MGYNVVGDWINNSTVFIIRLSLRGHNIIIKYEEEKAVKVIFDFTNNRIYN